MNNLELLTVDSGQQMAELFSRIEFFEIYLECFAQPPYEEYFTAEEVAGLFRSYGDKGIIIICLDVELSRCAGFVAAVPVTADAEIAAIARANGLEPADYWFLEDVGVGKAYRHRHIFSNMAQELRQKIAGKGILSRTQKDNIPSLKAHKKLGYRIVQGMTQLVTYKHLSGEIRQDERIFMKYLPK